MFIPWWVILAVVVVVCVLWHQREREFAKERAAWRRQEDRRLEQEENARMAADLTDETIEDWHLRQQHDPIPPRG
jgi:flagellar biosynthesis/type III secretory pathway M-ring protein FliF/YscJ